MNFEIFHFSSNMQMNLRWIGTVVSAGYASNDAAKSHLGRFRVPEDGKQGLMCWLC